MWHARAYHNAPHHSSHHSLSCRRIAKTCSDIYHSLDSISEDYHNLGLLQIYKYQILGKYINCKKDELLQRCRRCMIYHQFYLWH